MKNALRKYRDPFIDIFDGISTFVDEFNYNMFDYPYYRTINNVGKVNIEESENEYKIDVSVPGFTKEDLKIDLNDGVLIVSAEHKSESVDDKKNYSRKEFSKKSFSRSFRIPENITEDVDAKLDNGILSLSIKKKELPPKVDPKKIEIK